MQREKDCGHLAIDNRVSWQKSIARSLDHSDKTCNFKFIRGSEGEQLFSWQSTKNWFVDCLQNVPYYLCTVKKCCVTHDVIISWIINIELRVIHFRWRRINKLRAQWNAEELKCHHSLMVHLIGGASALNGDHNKAPACLFIRCCTYHIIIAKAFPHPSSVREYHHHRHRHFAWSLCISRSSWSDDCYVIHS